MQSTESGMRTETSDDRKTTANGTRDDPRWRALFEHAADAILVYPLDDDGEPLPYLEVNKAALRLYGYSRAEMLQMTSRDLVDLEAIDLRSAIDSLFEQPHQYFESRHIAKDGTRIPVQVEVHLVRMNGRATVLGICRDVSREKEAERALSEQEERLVQTLESMGESFLALDRDFRITYVNRRAAGAVGRDPVDLIGKNIFEEYPAYNGTPAGDAAIRAMAGTEPITLETYSPVTRRWLEGTFYPTPEGLSIFARDVSERKQIEAALRESEERFRLMADAAPVLIWRSDADKAGTWFNRRWLEFTGRSMEQEVGEGWIDGIHPDDRHEALRICGSAFDRREPFRAEFRLRRHDGQYRWVFDEATPLYGHDGSFTGFIGSCVDVHDRIEAREQLEELNLRLEERVAERTALAEERTRQLRAVAAELTRAEQSERRRLASTLHDHLQQLLVAAKIRLEAAANGSDRRSLLGEVDELIDQSVQVARSLAIQLSPPVLHEAGLCAGLEWLRRWMAEKHHLTVELELDRDAEPSDEHTRVVVFEAVRELLFNVAKHAMTTSARVDLSHHSNDTTEVMVIDNGVGFDPRSLSENGHALSGLGLRSIRERIGYFGGRVDVLSAPGCGTTVSLRLPREAVTLSAPARLYAPSVDNSGPATGESPERPIRVLLADDHKILREGIARLLRDFADIEVVGEAEDGVSAVELAMELAPDVVVMDITMPRMNGIDATREITAALSGTRVVGLSMHEESDMAGALERAGAVAYVTKGGPANDLIEAIRQAGRSG